MAILHPDGVKAVYYPDPIDKTVTEQLKQSKERILRKRRNERQGYTLNILHDIHISFIFVF